MAKLYYTKKIYNYLFTHNFCKQSNNKISIIILLKISFIINLYFYFIFK